MGIFLLLLLSMLQRREREKILLSTKKGSKERLSSKMPTKTREMCISSKIGMLKQQQKQYER